MSNNPKEVLKSMPASSIKRIEVITNPGPKYDAEGVGGILNIITHGKNIEGYTATFRANVHNQGLGAGAYTTVKSGKLTMSANVNYNYNDRPRGYSGSTRKTVGNISNSSSDIESSSWSDSHGNSKYGSLEASYEIDTLRLLTASFDLYGGGSNGEGESSLLPHRRSRAIICTATTRFSVQRAAMPISMEVSTINALFPSRIACLRCRIR